MTPQIRLALLGATAIIAARFYFKTDWKVALIAGVSTVAVVSTLTARDSQA